MFFDGEFANAPLYETMRKRRNVSLVLASQRSRCKYGDLGPVGSRLLRFEAWAAIKERWRSVLSWGGPGQSAGRAMDKLPYAP